MRSGSLIRIIAGGTVALLLTLSGAMVCAAEESLHMPLATQATLLDITRAGDRLVVVGEYGHILYSDDLGDSWIQARVPTRQMLTAVYFAGRNRGWAVGHDGLVLATVDGGANWVIQRDGLADQHLINRQEYDALELRAEDLKSRLLVAGTTAERTAIQAQLEELELDREDAEWQLQQPVHAPPLLDVFFVDDLRGVATGAFNTLLLTVDGGEHWQHVGKRLPNPEAYHLNAVTGSAEGEFWIAAEGGLLFHSADGGDSWEALPSPEQSSWFGISRAPLSGRLLAFGLRGVLYASDDGGRSWNNLSDDSTRTLSGGGFLTESYVLLAGSVGTLLLSVDGGQQFYQRHLEQRVNLSAALWAGEHVIAVGQGGVHRAAGVGERP